MGQIGPNMEQNMGFMGFMGIMDFMDWVDTLPYCRMAVYCIFGMRHVLSIVTHNIKEQKSYKLRCFRLVSGVGFKVILTTIGTFTPWKQ